MTATPRRTCPACSRRYAGLIAPDCPICQGLGVLTLGAAILHHYDPAPAARAIELFLEAKTRHTRATLPLAQHRAALEAHVDELRVAGVLASTADAAGTPARETRAPADAASRRIAELDAYRATRTLGATPTPTVLNALNAPEVPLHIARPRDGRPPQASATGNPTAIATTADPINPLAVHDTPHHENARAANDHHARVIAAAVPTAATRRRHRP